MSSLPFNTASFYYFWAVELDNRTAAERSLGTNFKNLNCYSGYTGSRGTAGWLREEVWSQWWRRVQKNRSKYSWKQQDGLCACEILRGCMTALAAWAGGCMSGCFKWWDWPEQGESSTALQRHPSVSGRQELMFSTSISQKSLYGLWYKLWPHDWVVKRQGASASFWCIREFKQKV